VPVAGADAADGAGPPWPGGAAWVDGRYCPVEEAKISVLDLGVTRSDCTYDVVHVWDGRFFRLADHLDRFTASLARLRLDPGCDRGQIEAVVHGCVRHAGLREAYVSMTCTRGQPVGTGTPGPLTGRLRDRYWASHADPRYATPVRYDQPG
jgi:branched-chain amino acid aminotransferase